MNWTESDRELIWHPYSPLNPQQVCMPIASGKGTLLFDTDGRPYIDAISSWWVNIHGHAHAYIAKRVYEQFLQLEHVIFAGFTHEPAVELARRLLPKLPGDMKRMFYSDNGSTAVEVALKMAIQWWALQDKPRKKLIALENAYHGDTFGAMSVSQRGLFTKPFTDLLFDVEFIPAPYPGVEEESYRALEKALSGDDIAAIIVEPLVQGASGMLMYSPESLQKLMHMAKSAGVLVIADEVMTGFGRTGTLFATQQVQETPDIICMSKGITGGVMPLGATACNAKIADMFTSTDASRTLFHGHSFTANPLSCAASLASLDLVEMPETMQAISRIVKRHQAFGEEIKSHPLVANIRQTGTIIAFDIISGSGNHYLHSIREKVAPFALERGVLLRPLGNILYILPPYCITDEELTQVYQCITDLLHNLHQN